MKNHFTITVSDVRGSKSYSFNQLVRKFSLFFVLFLVLLFSAGAVTIWWLSQEAVQIEQKKVEALASYQDVLVKNKASFSLLNNEKEKLQFELDNKSKQIQFLDQTLQGLEKLLGIDSDNSVPVKDRIELVQLTTLEKKIMLENIPNGVPVKDFKGITSKFGWRIHPVTGKRHHHNGLDYRGKPGDDIIATANGIVEYSGYHKKSGFGNMVIIGHAYGFKTIYAHMSKLGVKTGQVVKKGEYLGDIGSTGLSSGPHLHYEVSFLHRNFNPIYFVKWDINNYDKIFKNVKGVPWGSLSQAVQNRVQMVEKQLSLRDVK